MKTNCIICKQELYLKGKHDKKKDYICPEKSCRDKYMKQLFSELDNVCNKLNELRR